MRILVADTDEEQLELLQSFLWDRGHEAEIATDGLECAVTLCEFQPEVVVIEEKLIGGDPDGILTTMREDQSLSGIPVVLITAEMTASELHAAVTAPVVSWLPKSYRLGDLLERIESARSCHVRSPASTAHLADGGVFACLDKPCTVRQIEEAVDHAYDDHLDRSYDDGGIHHAELEDALIPGTNRKQQNGTPHASCAS